MYIYVLTPYNYDEHYYNTRKTNWGAAFFFFSNSLQFQMKKGLASIKLLMS